MERIKVGLAAYGMSGQVFHAPFIHTNPHFELSKIVERSKELSKERYPYAMIVRSFEELIQDPAIELVVVNTPVLRIMSTPAWLLRPGKACDCGETVYIYYSTR